ncbi:MAG: ribbon-helix-helix protein, CopG family [Deltaproteobacteria bacterium]|nr:ribbon-helix-helix protein, CopG family [Deltaproteobacteria bacterium]
MKISISLPDNTALEIKKLAEETQRNVSWLIQKAWDIARTQMMRHDENEVKRKKAMRGLLKLQGALKKDFPNISSVDLAHMAFRLKKR